MTRRSKREIEKRVEELSDGPPGEYPVVDSLARLLGYDWTAVDEEQHLYENERGDVYYMDPEFLEVVSEKLED